MTEVCEKDFPQCEQALRKTVEMSDEMQALCTLKIADQEDEKKSSRRKPDQRTIRTGMQ